jgi:hypothetical protein
VPLAMQSDLEGPSGPELQSKGRFMLTGPLGDVSRQPADCVLVLVRGVGSGGTTNNPLTLPQQVAIYSMATRPMAGPAHGDAALHSSVHAYACRRLCGRLFSSGKSRHLPTHRTTGFPSSRSSWVSETEHRLVMSLGSNSAGIAQISAHPSLEFLLGTVPTYP